MIDKKDLELKLLLRESHIQQLNLRVNNLSSTIDKLLKRNDDLKEEIKRLKESEEYHRKGYAELYKRIDEAIEYIEENYTQYGEEDDFWSYRLINADNTLDILKGDDKDEN